MNYNAIFFFIKNINSLQSISWQLLNTYKKVSKFRSYDSLLNKERERVGKSQFQERPLNK